MRHHADDAHHRRAAVVALRLGGSGVARRQAGGKRGRRRLSGTAQPLDRGCSGWWCGERTLSLNFLVSGSSSEPRAATIFATVVLRSRVFSSSMTWDMAAMVSLGCLFSCSGAWRSARFAPWLRGVFAMARRAWRARGAALRPVRGPTPRGFRAGELELKSWRGSRARHFPRLPVRGKLLKHGSSEREMHPRPGGAAARRARDARSPRPAAGG